ncbi:MAG: PHP domain-containing protein, partial [Planctomycetota bacterium]
SIGDAFGRHIGATAPGFVDKERLTSAEAIDAIHAACGLAVLAHPPELNFSNFAQLDRFVRSLVSEGLDGLECIHSECSTVQTRHYLDLAKRLGLLVSGGSDFHGPANLDVRLGRPRVPVAVVEQLLARLAG